MPDNVIKISDLNEALAIANDAEIAYVQNNGGTLTTFKAPLTQIGAKLVEDMTYAGIDLPSAAGDKTIENSLNYLIDAVGGDPNGNISDYYDPTAAYVKGDLCIYENVLYICTATTTGTFDPSKWTATTIDNVIGSLSSLTTTDKSSLVGAVNSKLPRVVYSEKNWGNTHSFDTPNDVTFMLYTDSDNAVAKVRIFSNNTTYLYNIAGSSITSATYTDGTLTITTTNRGLIAVQIL